jgi:iron(III) transport system ATP-binding protein
VLLLENLTKTFRDRSGPDDVVAVSDVSLEVEEGEFFTLLGPSGCGKTTTLRMVAGLEEPNTGRIQIDGSVLFDAGEGIDVPPHRRGLGMVFQSYAIWPHMTCAKNVGYPLSRRGARQANGERWTKSSIEAAVERALDLVQLGNLANRPATDLSGGQQQRLALARALVADPPLMLLDEPLSNLDARLREDMRIELKRMQRDLGITSLYVTHDQTEALAMSNRIGVMRRGRLEQLGTPREIYEAPKSQFVAEFIGQCNFIRGTVERLVGDGRWLLHTHCGPLEIGSARELTVGEEVTVSVRPEHVGIQPYSGSVDPKPGNWPGTVETGGFLGDSIDHRVSVGGTLFRVKSHTASVIPAGSSVLVRIPADWCTIVAYGS